MKKKNFLLLPLPDREGVEDDDSYSALSEKEKIDVIKDERRFENPCLVSGVNDVGTSANDCDINILT